MFCKVQVNAETVEVDLVYSIVARHDVAEGI